MTKSKSAVSPLMREVSAYIAGAARRALPGDVVEKGKHHLLDTLASMISGSRLLPGKRAIAYIAGLAGARQACVAGTRLVTTAANAAFANGMFAHADETDDTHYAANMHPGCGIVPAALAMAAGSDASTAAASPGRPRTSPTAAHPGRSTAGRSPKPVWPRSCRAWRRRRSPDRRPAPSTPRRSVWV